MTNYTNPTNITSFTGAMDYTGISYPLLPVILLGFVWVAFTIVASKYSQERALVYSTFMTTIVAFLLVSGNLLQPEILIICLVGLIAAVWLSRSE